MDLVAHVLPEDLQDLWRQKLEAYEGKGMLMGNVLTPAEGAEEAPVDVAAVFYRGEGRILVTGIAPEYAAEFEGHIRWYLRYFFVTVHGGHKGALANFRVRYDGVKVGG